MMFSDMNGAKTNVMAVRVHLEWFQIEEQLIGRIRIGDLISHGAMMNTLFADELPSMNSVRS